MSLIYNNSDGIKNKAVYERLKSIVHPRSGFLRRGISEDKALHIKNLFITICDDFEDLDFLKFFPNLEKLHLFSKNLSNVDGLKYTKNLTELELGSDWLVEVDISAIGICKELETLIILADASSTYMEASSHSTLRVTGLDSLGELTKLTTLAIMDMGISDISFIKNMKYLKDVDLSENQLTDISELSGNLSIEILTLSFCNLTDISPLGEVSNLRNVILTRNHIKDFSPLRKLQNLKFIYAKNNGLSPQEIKKWESEFSHMDEVEF